MKWHEDALGRQTEGTGTRRTRRAAISSHSLHNPADSWKSDPGVHGLVLEIKNTPTAELREQVRLLRAYDDVFGYAAARRRRLALAEVVRRMVVRNA